MVRESYHGRLGPVPASVEWLYVKGPAATRSKMMFAPVLGLDEARGGPVEAVSGGSAASSGTEAASLVDAAFRPPEALSPCEPPAGEPSELPGAGIPASFHNVRYGRSGGAGSGARPRRILTPHTVTSHRASNTIRREILDWPCSRSRNVMGTSPSA